MLKRVITGTCVLLALVVLVIFSGTIAFPISFAAIGVVCLYEMFKCMGIHKKASLVLPPYLSALVFPFLLRYMDSNVKVALIAAIVALLYLIYVYAHVIWSHGKFAFSEGMSVYAAALYILVALNAVLYIRDFGDSGKYIFVLIFVGAWVTDTFAYFTGMFFGKHKLIEDVSPKKTIEGSIGGIFFCALFFVGFGFVTEFFFERNANMLFLAVSGVIASVISQVGDLIMSVIKRHYGIKDYGKIFPGHGGMLDRFDSILAVSVGITCICMFATLTGIGLI